MMQVIVRAVCALGVIAASAMTLPTGRAYAQSASEPTNSAPNPYRTIENYFKLPEGRTWGATSAVDIDKDGKSIWVAERCQANSCLDRATGRLSDLPVVMKFDESGKLVRSFGAGLIIFPHGIHVDADGNIWVTDGQDDAPQAARGAPGGGRGGAPGAAAPGAATPPAGPPPAPAPGDARAGGPPAGGAPQGAPGAGGARAGRTGGAGGAAQRMGPAPGSTRGHQVYKFSPEGKLLLTLGKAGGAAAPDYFYQPNDVVVARDGTVFVSEGHGGGNSRILKFSKDGKFLTSIGSKGSGSGQFDQPHALAFDSRGRLFVADRSNNRIVIMDQDGKFLEEWTQFSRPSGIYIDKNDMLYVADSESGSIARDRTGWKRGIRIGSARDGKVQAFIPDPNEATTGTSAAEGVAVDAAGHIYGAEVGPRALKKYMK